MKRNKNTKAKERGTGMGKKAKPIILILVMALLVGGFYFYLSNKVKTASEDDAVTAVQDVLLKNLEKNYPPTPKEVVKYYSEISNLYNEEYTDEQLAQMADKLLAIYDDELVANNPREEYIENIKKDVQKFKDDSFTISTFTPSQSTDVVYYTTAGRECAEIYCNYTIRSGSKYSTSQQRFILRKDIETQHWKILGFDGGAVE